jgi:stress response protein YsnF
MDNPRSSEPDMGTGTDEVVSVAEETVSVSKHQVETGRVRVHTRVNTVEEMASANLRSDRFEVTRVAVDTIVDDAPQVRTEGDVTIVPVLEEVLVVETKLVLKEEIHIRHIVETEIVEMPVVLRRQHAVVERLDAGGRPLPEEDEADEHGHDRL